MTLSDLFWGLGDIFQWTFQILDGDKPFTWFMNLAILIGGFVGLFYWLRLQYKFNQEAQNEPNRMK